MNIGTPELVIIFILALIFFGPHKLPEIGRSLGKGIRELKKASRDLTAAINFDDDYDLEREVSAVKETVEGSISDAVESDRLKNCDSDHCEKG